MRLAKDRSQWLNIRFLHPLGRICFFVCLFKKKLEKLQILMKFSGNVDNNRGWFHFDGDRHRHLDPGISRWIFIIER